MEAAAERAKKALGRRAFEAGSPMAEDSLSRLSRALRTLENVRAEEGGSPSGGNCVGPASNPVTAAEALPALTAEEIRARREAAAVAEGYRAAPVKVNLGVAFVTAQSLKAPAVLQKPPDDSPAPLQARGWPVSREASSEADGGDDYVGDPADAESSGEESGLVSEELELGDRYTERWIQGTLKRLQAQWPRTEEPVRSEFEAPEPIAPLASPRDPDEGSDDDDDHTLGALTSAARYGPDGMPLEAEEDGTILSAMVGDMPVEDEDELQHQEEVEMMDKVPPEELVTEEVGDENVCREDGAPPSAWRSPIRRPPGAAMGAAENFTGVALADPTTSCTEDAENLATAATDAPGEGKAQEASDAPGEGPPTLPTSPPEPPSEPDPASDLMEPPPREPARFLLRVQLRAGEEQPLEFHEGEDVNPKVREFARRHRLDETVEDMLAEHAKEMVRSGNQADAVDAMDLLMRDMRNL